MNKINKTDTLRTIMSGNRFTVNYYQREYRWGKKQVEQLIDDLSTTFSSYYDSVAHTDTSEVEKYGYYFMGSIIRTTGAEREIVDGQQRLTTLSLLFIYINNLLKARGEKIDEVAPMVYSSKFGKKCFNIDVDDRAACFENLFRNELNFIPENESSKNMLERYKDICELFPDELKGEALKFFTYWLIEKVLLLEIEAPTEDEAQTIFVTMNDRGLSLNSAEMLKAFILKQVAAPWRNEVNAVWQNTIAKIKNDADADKSSASSAGDVEFISIWHRGNYAQTARDNKKGALDGDYELLGDKFHEWVRANANVKMGLQKSDDFRLFITKEMVQVANLYLQIRTYSRTLTSGYEDIYYNSNRGLYYQTMLIISAVNRTDSPEVTDKKLRIVAKFVDIFSSTRLVNSKKVNYNTNKYLIFRLMNQIRNVDLASLGIILTQTIKNMYETLDGIDDFRLNQFSTQYMLHLLARITSYINVQMGNPSEFDRYIDRQIKNAFDIEHILPDDFATYANEFNDEEDFTNYRARFGNLILLTKDKNRSYQDMPYARKVKQYFGDNILAQSMNSQAYVNNPKFLPLALKFGFGPFDQTFGKDGIRTRQNIYKAIAQDIWNVDAIKVIAGGWTDEQEAEYTQSSTAQIVDAAGEASVSTDAASWVIPCNTNSYDITKSINEFQAVEWQQWASVKPGDLVYIYVSDPVRQIKYKCFVTNTNIGWDQREIDDAKHYKSSELFEKSKGKMYIRLRLLRVYDSGVLTFNQLKEAGNRSNFQGAMHVNEAITAEIVKVENA